MCARLSQYAVDGDDLSSVRNKSIRSAFEDSEFDGLKKRVRSELLPVAAFPVPSRPLSVAQSAEHYRRRGRFLAPFPTSSVEKTGITSALTALARKLGSRLYAFARQASEIAEPEVRLTNPC